MTGNKLKKQSINREVERSPDRDRYCKNYNHTDMLLSSKFNQPSIENMTVMKNGTSV